MPTTPTDYTVTGCIIVCRTLTIQLIVVSSEVVAEDEYKRQAQAGLIAEAESLMQHRLCSVLGTDTR